MCLILQPIRINNKYRNLKLQNMQLVIVLARSTALIGVLSRCDLYTALTQLMRC